MDIIFKAEEQNQSNISFTGIVRDIPVGHALILNRYEHVADLTAIWLVDKEKAKLSLREFAEAFCRHLKNQGYTELWLTSEDIDSGDALGLHLEDRDNAGWYPKYFFRREL